jgi:hypothetical protein
MKKQLSADSVAAAYGYFAVTGLLLPVACVLAVQLSYGWAYLVSYVLVTARLIHQLTFHQVALLNGTLVVSRVFTKTRLYPAHEFVALEETKAYSKPLRISFSDGRSFTFLPRLKTSTWSIRYLVPEIFIKHRTREIRMAANATADHKQNQKNIFSV